MATAGNGDEFSLVPQWLKSNHGHQSPATGSHAAGKAHGITTRQHLQPRFSSSSHVVSFILQCITACSLTTPSTVKKFDRERSPACAARHQKLQCIVVSSQQNAHITADILCWQACYMSLSHLSLQPVTVSATQAAAATATIVSPSATGSHIWTLHLR